VWSNGAVSADDERSPWLRDDWDAEPSTAPPDGASDAEPPDATATTGMPRNQVVLGVIVGVVLLAVGTVALVRDDGAVAVPGATTGTTAPTATDVTVTTTPATVADEPSATVGPTTPAVAEPGSASEVPVITPGEPVVWSESTIDVPPVLATVAPTEVVAMTGEGLLHRIDLPSGRVRTADASGLEGIDGDVAVGERALVLKGPNDVYRIPDEGPVLRVEWPDGVIWVQSRPGTDEFVVTSPAVSGTDREREFLLQPDGRMLAAPEGRVADGVIWARTYSPTGDVLVNRPGGVYAIDGAGDARRIDDGDLVATGTRHYAVEQCDDQLVCTIRVVEWSTGESAVYAAGPLRSDGFLDPSTRVSPDGRAIVFRGLAQAVDARRVYVLPTGEVVDVGRVSKVIHADTWAADGSGLFRDDAGVVHFVSLATRESVQLGDLGGVTDIATRPLPPG
jgi:hypothetical protein